MGYNIKGKKYRQNFSSFGDAKETDTIGPLQSTFNYANFKGGSPHCQQVVLGFPKFCNSGLQSAQVPAQTKVCYYKNSVQEFEGGKDLVK